MSVNQVDLFEGIAMVDVDGVAHDTYMTIRTESVGYTIRWFGSFGWMGKAPEGIFHGEFLDVVLSDGRECKIQTPHDADENGRVEFLGVKLPPGFQSLAPETMETELVVQHASWRVWISRLFALLAVLLVFSSIWWEPRRWEALGTGLLLSLVAIHFAPTPLKEIPDDCPH